MGYLIYITLAVKREVLICYNIFYYMCGYIVITGDMEGSVLAEKAILEVFQLIVDVDLVIRA